MTLEHSKQKPLLIQFNLTKYVNAKPFIYWTEETINKLNKPPRNKECNGYREKYHTAIISQLNTMSSLKTL